MSTILAAEATHHVALPTMLAAEAPDGPYRVVFEDDGEEAMFFAIADETVVDENDDEGETAGRVVDALRIYEVGDVVDADHDVHLQILWAEDGSAAALLLNGLPHAFFDFTSQIGSCRLNQPGATGGWRRLEWSDEIDIMELLAG